MPESAGIVGHHIGLPGDMVVCCHVSVLPLVERTVTQEVRSRRGRRSGTFCRPRQSGPVVRGNPHSAFADIGVGGEDIFVGNDGREFQVRDRNATAWVGGGDQRSLDLLRKLETPQEWVREDAGCVKPHATHATLARIRCA